MNTVFLAMMLIEEEEWDTLMSNLAGVPSSEGVQFTLLAVVAHFVLPTNRAHYTLGA